MKKSDKILHEINKINVTLAKQHITLVEHVKRSNMLEAKMVPVEKHVAMVQGALKFIGLVSLICGMLVGIKELAEWLV